MRYLGHNFGVYAYTPCCQYSKNHEFFIQDDYGTLVKIPVVALIHFEHYKQPL